MKLCERNFRIKTIIFINHKNNLPLVKKIKNSSYLEFKLGKNVSKKKKERIDNLTIQKSNV